jgi:hypothetical protein
MNLVSVSVVVVGLASVVAGQDISNQAQQLEAKGDAIAARQLLQRAARNAPENASALLSYAEFLDRYNDPETRTNYEKALARLNGASDSPKRAAVARRLVLLDLIEGDREAAAKHMELYHAAGGRDFGAKIPAGRPESRDEKGIVEIPGPLASFARMAAVSSDISGTDLLPALARNVITNGYQAGASSETLEPTEYMKLVIRYLSQARELAKMAGDQQMIRVDTCESPQTGELLRILGYRMRGLR